jgi:hypothetical protein
METFLTIIGLIAAVLNLILFFKVWGMTNDVKKIRKRFINKYEDLSFDEVESELNIYIVKRDKEGAKTFLTECLLSQLAIIPLDSLDYNNTYMGIITRYKIFFELIGEKLPCKIGEINSRDFRVILDGGLK